MKRVRVNHVGVGEGFPQNETFRTFGGDLVVVYHADSVDNAGVKGKAGTTRRIRNEDYLPLRVMRLKGKYRR
jgi:hypothetical protein